MPFSIVDILSLSGDICDHSLKLSEIPLNFGRPPPQILEERLQIYGPSFQKVHQFPIMWQSFAAIGGGASEIITQYPLK